MELQFGSELILLAAPSHQAAQLPKERDHCASGGSQCRSPGHAWVYDHPRGERLKIPSRVFHWPSFFRPVSEQCHFSFEVAAISDVVLWKSRLSK
jgi:hypothetical protein